MAAVARGQPDCRSEQDQANGWSTASVPTTNDRQALIHVKFLLQRFSVVATRLAKYPKNKPRYRVSANGAAVNLPPQARSSCTTLCKTQQLTSPGRRIGPRRGATRAPGPGAKTGVRAELHRSAPLLCGPFRDWPESVKPSRHDAATLRTGCPARL